MARQMSDTEIRRRKKLQGHLSQATGTLGLASLGAFGASKLPAAKVLTKTPALRRLGASRTLNAINPKKAEGAALGLSTAGAGLGGAGSFNFAAYTGAESKKRKQAVSKGIGMEMGYYGEEGNPVQLPQIEVPIEKAWSPVASNFDSEASRHKRTKGYQGATLAGAGVGSAVAGIHGTKAVQAAGKLKPGSPLKALTKPGGVASHGKKAVAGLAGVAVAAGANAALKHKEKNSWRSYAKRDTTSAFGIDHMLEAEWTAP